MKNVIIGFFLMAFIATGNSQILLGESVVDYKKSSMKIDPATQTLVIKIPEKKLGEFGKDPLTFMKNNFEIEQLLSDNANEDYTKYQVNFITKNGKLIAIYNNDGELISSKQRFKNMRLPYDVQLEVAKLYNGATILGTKSFAHSRGWEIEKEYYKIKLNYGDKTRRIRIHRDNNQLSIAGL